MFLPYVLWCFALNADTAYLIAYNATSPIFLSVVRAPSQISSIICLCAENHISIDKLTAILSYFLIFRARTRGNVFCGSSCNIDDIAEILVKGYEVKSKPFPILNDISKIMFMLYVNHF